ncbi:MAG: S-layer homology domain-containing protein [Bacillota bacterium]
MRSKVIMLLMVIVLLFTVSGGLAFAESYFDFPDVGDHWALEPITQCKIYNLVKGYPEGRFYPERALSRAEALILICKGLGLDSQVGKISTKGISFPADLPMEYRGYIALSADKQLIGKEIIQYMQFNSPATRLEVALWIARALNVKGTGEGSLVFTDTRNILSADKDMLSGIVEAGIMNGYPDNTFRPSKSLTRAEMASILARMLDKGNIKPISGSHVMGKLVQVDTVGQKVTVQSSGVTNTYQLAPGMSVVFRNGVKSSLTDFREGENVKLALNSKGKCIFLAAIGRNEKPGGQAGSVATYKGTVTSITGTYLVFQPDNGNAFLKYISPLVNVTKSGSTVSIKSVAAGSKGTITVSGDIVSRIDLSGVQTFPAASAGKKGRVINKYLDHFTVRMDSNSVRDAVWVSGVAFIKDGNITSYEAVKQGTYVELIERGSWVETVYVLGGVRKILGVVEGINSRSVTVEDGDERSVSLDISSECKVRDANSRLININDIKSGMYVELSLNDNDSVSEIKKLKDTKDLEGELTYIKTGDIKRIKIERKDDTVGTYYLADNVKIRERGVDKSLSELEEGMYVLLNLNSKDEVISIYITERPSYYKSAIGEVIELQYSGTKKIVIQKSSGVIATYYLDDYVVIKEGSTTRGLPYIEKGMDVELTIESNDKVTLIKIIDSSTSSGAVKGRITAVNLTNDYIKINKNGDSIITYYFAENVTVKEGSATRGLSYLEEGMDVELTLNSDGKVTKIATGPKPPKVVKGTVTFIKAFGAARITIKNSDNSETAYYTVENVKIKEGASDRSLYYIKEGMYVELTVNGDDDVIRIDIIR